MIFPEIYLPTTKRLFGWLLLKTMIILAIIMFAGIGLGPDEAQYWTWSQSLDWGYYSKPPGIAWQIWLGTKIFGSTELGVRFISVILAVFQAFAVYLMSLRAGLKERSAFWCGILMAYSPLGILGSFFAITDAGMLFCWSGACITLISSLKENKAPNPLQLGAWIAAGALFKWTIFLFWVFYLICLYLYFPKQKKTTVLAALTFSLFGLIPSLWWNAMHNWATFRHVFATVIGGSGHHYASGNFAEFIGAQALLLSPILFVLLLLGFYQWLRFCRQLSPPLFFCGLTTLSLLLSAILFSCFKKVQGNWVDFAYPTGIIIIVWYALERKVAYPNLLKSGIGLAVGLVLLFFTMPLIDSKYLKHNLGWNELEVALKDAGYDPNRHYLFSDKYQTSSILSFYSERKKRAYFLNLQGIRNNQFSYWPSLFEEQKMKTVFLFGLKITLILGVIGLKKRSTTFAQLKLFFC